MPLVLSDVHDGAMPRVLSLLNAAVLTLNKYRSPRVKSCGGGAFDDGNVASRNLSHVNDHHHVQ